MTPPRYYLTVGGEVADDARSGANSVNLKAEPTPVVEGLQRARLDLLACGGLEARPVRQRLGHASCAAIPGEWVGACRADDIPCGVRD